MEGSSTIPMSKLALSLLPATASSWHHLVHFAVSHRQQQRRPQKLSSTQHAGSTSTDNCLHKDHNLDPRLPARQHLYRSASTVGKISRRVCLVHYPEPGEFEKPSFSNLNLSSQRSEGSSRRSKSRHSKHGTDGISRDTLTSTHSFGQRSMELSQHSKQKRHEDSTAPSEISMRSAERSSRASGPGSQVSNISFGSEQSRREKSKKKKIKVEE